MARTYKREIDVPQNFEVLEWELISDLTEIFSRYMSDEKPFSALNYTAEDARGVVNEESLDEFRTAIGQHHDRPTRISITFEGDGPTFHAWWSDDKFRRGGIFASTTEADVVYVAERAAAAFDRAVARASERDAPSVIMSGPSLLGPMGSYIQPPLWHRIIYNPYAVTVGGGLLVVIILAAIYALMR
jgi:hypothetical protein